MVQEVIVAPEDLAANIQALFERVVRDGDVVVIERAGEPLATIKPARRRRTRRRAQSDREAFLSSAGSWHDVDVDAFVADLYASRSISTRPPIEL